MGRRYVRLVAVTLLLGGCAGWASDCPPCDVLNGRAATMRPVEPSKFDYPDYVRPKPCQVRGGFAYCR
jgi:hypothetical protein